MWVFKDRDTDICRVYGKAALTFMSLLWMFISTNPNPNPSPNPSPNPNPDPSPNSSSTCSHLCSSYTAASDTL